MKDFVDQGALKPIDYARERARGELRPRTGSTSAASTARCTASSSRAPTSRPSGTTSRRSRTPAWSRPTTWEDLLAGAKTLKASGVKAYSIGGADGWTLTDLFENIYLRTGRSGHVRQADQPRHPVDRPVGHDGAARTWRRSSATPANIAGGTTGALQTDFPTSVTQRLHRPAQGRDGLRGRLRPGRDPRLDQGSARDRLQPVRLPVRRRLAGRAWSAVATRS